MNYSDYFYECDGPPRAFFELKDATCIQHEPFLFRGVYECLVIFGDTEKAVQARFDEILRTAAGTSALADSDLVEQKRFLIWRKRPYISERSSDDPPGPKFKLRARFWISNFTLAFVATKNEADQYQVTI